MTKASWGDGPWVYEPDVLNWVDEATGLRCAVRRSNVTGALCGYVELPMGHRWTGKSYKELMDSIDFSEVHCGVSWSKPNLPVTEPEGTWWVGFDCFHHGDLCPQFTVKPSTDDELDRRTMIETRDTLEEHARYEAGEKALKPIYRDIEYVCGHVQRLAQEVMVADG